MGDYLIVGTIASLWVLWDGISRRIWAAGLIWGALTVLFLPITLPLYRATRPLRKGETREGGTAWNVLKNFVVLWTVLMAYWAASTAWNISRHAGKLQEGLDQVAFGVGAAAGLVLIGAASFIPMVAAALLGFFIRTPAVIERGPTGPLAEAVSPNGHCA